ncbi:hexitol phosphatase HxpB [bacterium]|nr:hexitol phosphatase HxpB [bacterium]
MKSFTTCIFDMDGVLLDSEPFWRQAQMRIFAEVGLNLNEEDCRQTTGIRIDELVRFRYGQQPWTGPSCAEVSAQIQNTVGLLISQHGRTLPGVREAVNFMRSQGLRLALASSSSLQLIDITLKTLGLQNCFELIHSAENEPLGKPHPAVFLHTAEKLGEKPVSCLVIEDSLNGVIAAKAAQMTCVVVPDRADNDNPKFIIADLTLKNLTELPARWPDIVK